MRGLKPRLGRRALRAADRLTGQHHIPLSYPPNAENVARYGHGRPPHGRLAELLGRSDDRYAANLDLIGGYRDAYRRIAVRDGAAGAPSWINGFLPGLDGAAIYAFLRSRAPRRYVEVGSGNSTRFAAQAKRDGGLRTTITSIDPQPRAEIDALCDRVIRQPFERVDSSAFADIEDGDVVFFDGSHCTFMNNDVVAFFLDVLPALSPGVLVGIHDVYLPDDYPESVASRYYSEQYVLAAYLLGEPPVNLELPAHYATRHPRLGRAVEAIWDDAYLSEVEHHGVAFWLTTG